VAISKTQLTTCLDRTLDHESAGVLHGMCTPSGMNPMKLEDFIAISESSDVPEGTESPFHRRFKRGVPDFPHYVVATYRGAGRALQLACYIHSTDCGDILLGGHPISLGSRHFARH